MNIFLDNNKTIIHIRVANAMRAKKPKAHEN